MDSSNVRFGTSSAALSTAAANVRRKQKEKREKLLYKIACTVYGTCVILLFTFMIVRAFNYKYEIQDEPCTNTTTGWMDTVISILTLIVIIIATFTLIASFKYVFASSITTPMDDKISSVLNSNLTHNLENSRNLIHIPNPSPRGSDSWLNNVRNQAYETRRQSYLNPQLKI